MFKRNKKAESVYLPHCRALSAKGRKPLCASFSLPLFDETSIGIGRRVAATTEVVMAKIEAGHLDAANVDFIALCYQPVLEELEAELEAYRISCEVELDHLRAALTDQVAISNTAKEVVHSESWQNAAARV